MNINKFTQKSIEAVNQCEKIAYDHGHQEIDQEHFLYSLLTIDDSLIASLLEKMGINKETFLSQVQELLNKKPRMGLKNKKHLSFFKSATPLGAPKSQAR